MCTLLLCTLLLMQSTVKAEEPPLLDIKTSFDVLFGSGKRFEQYRENLAEYLYNNAALDLDTTDVENIQSVVSRQHISSFRNRFPVRFQKTIQPFVASVNHKALYSRVIKADLDQFAPNRRVQAHISHCGHNPSTSMILLNTFVFKKITIEK